MRREALKRRGMGSTTEANIDHRQEESHFFMASAGKQEKDV